MNLSKSRIAVAAAAAVLALIAASPSRVNAQGFGGGGGRPAFGTISAIDATGKTITVTNEATGDSTTVSVNSDTTIITQAPSSASAVKVGDSVRVSGVPTGITATSITDGEMPRIGRGGPGGPGGPGGGPGGPGGGPGAGGPGGRPGGPGGNDASVQGTVKSLSPLTVSLPGGISIVVSGVSKATVTKIEHLKFSDLKLNDRVFAPGTTGDDGVLTASLIGVNITMGGRGGGGFGGGGFGGGGFGGRGRRGGGGPGGPGPDMGPGDGGGAPPPPDGGDGQAPPPPPQ